MEKRIFILLFALIILAGTMLMLRACLEPKCISPVLNYEPPSSLAGETVNFSSNINDAQDYTWDFGDRTVNSHDSTPSHIFDSPGNYTIKLKLNGDEKCVGSINITVREKTKIRKIAAKILPYQINQSGKGKELIITDATPRTNQWNWTSDDGDNFSGREFHKIFYRSEVFRVKLSASGDGIVADTTLNVPVSINSVNQIGCSTPTNKLNDAEFKKLFSIMVDSKVDSERDEAFFELCRKLKCGENTPVECSICGNNKNLTLGRLNAQIELSNIKIHKAVFQRSPSDKIIVIN